MMLYVMRHGIALEIGEQGIVTDEDRPLSSEGRERTREIAEGLRALGLDIDLVATSPLPRAEQTARIAAERVGGSPKVVLCEHLRPGGRAADLILWLRKQSARSIVIVGHNPDLGTVISRLATGTERMSVNLKKAGVCCLSFDGPLLEGAGVLEWLLPPGQLRKLGGA